MRRDYGPIFHGLGGAAIAVCATLVGIPGWLILVSITLGGWLREVAQHDLRLTIRQWIEALSWLAGSSLVLVLQSFLV